MGSITIFNIFGYFWSRNSVNTLLHSVTCAGKQNNVLIISCLSYHPRQGKSIRTLFYNEAND